MATLHQATDAGSGRPGGRELVWLAAMWALVVAYDFAKPYHIDDTAYVQAAQWIAAHPLHPLSGPLNWGGTAPIWQVDNSPGYSFVMAAWGRLFGFGEAAMHALQSLVALACVALTWRLARAVAPRLALWSTALVIMGPAFIVELNAMIDAPLLALWLGFFNLLIVDSGSARQHRRYALAGLLCGLAILVKYSGLTLAPMLALSILLERRLAQAWTLLIPAAMATAWSAFNLADYGGIHLLSRLGGTSLQRLPLMAHIGAWIAALGALTPLGWVALAQGPWRRGAWLICAAAAIGLAGLAGAVAVGLVSDTGSDTALRALFLVSGLLAAGAAAAWRLARPSTWSRKDSLPRLYLMLWLLGGSAFYILFAPFIAARHVLIVLPAVTLLVAQRWQNRIGAVAQASALALTVLVSAGLCLSDWRFAAFYRDEAPIMARAYPPTASAVRFGGTWGWQWYALKTGFRQTDQTSAWRNGDIVIASSAPGSIAPPPGAARVVRTDTEGAPLLSLVCSARVARLYASDSAGPWSLSRDCVETLKVFRVEGSAGRSGPDGL